MSRVVSGMKPTGRLHLGNLEGALRGWLRLQDEHELYCFIADWHAWTAANADPAAIQAATQEVALDYLAAGLDPARAAIFVQSEVREHAELYLCLSMLTPVAWLERVPAYKAASEGASHGFLGYPVLQAADVLLYRGEQVPVGRDQLPHLELAREIARRFNQRLGPLFPEPQAVLAGAGEALPGLDGRKMSKSYGNVIYLADSEEETARKIMGAYTTPTKLRASDPGVPEGCAVCQWRRIYDASGYERSWEEDRRGERGCVANKRELVEIMNARLAPLRARRRELERAPEVVEAALQVGAEKARAVAQETMGEVRRRLRMR